MGESNNELTYAAVITISLPGADKDVNLVVTLTPAAPVAVGNGRVKPLRDCTLAELQQFADAVEAGILAQYEDARLADLADQEPAQVNVTILDAADASQPVESMLEHAIVFPEPAQEAAEATSPAGEPTGAPETPAAAQEESPEQAAPEEEALEQKEAEEPEPEVSVSESEPVYQEREAPLVAETPVAVPSRVRILGKRRPLHHPTWTAVDILMNEPAFRDAQAHSLTSLDREVAGILVGPPPEKQPDGRYVVHVSDTIIARHTRMQGASVTYTPESWRYVNDKLAEMYPDETAVIVGWYHTHPSFGIFLSSMDQFIHQNFFTQIWHVALVLDPLARRSGFFCWDRYKSRVDRYEFPWPEWAGDSW